MRDRTGDAATIFEEKSDCDKLNTIDIHSDISMKKSNFNEILIMIWIMNED